MCESSNVVRGREQCVVLYKQVKVAIRKYRTLIRRCMSEHTDLEVEMNKVSASIAVLLEGAHKQRIDVEDLRDEWLRLDYEWGKRYEVWGS